MTHEEIKKGLADNGLNFSALARASRRSYQLFSGVSSRKQTSLYAARIIAAALEKSVEEVFPDKPEYARSSPDLSLRDRDSLAAEIIAQVNQSS